MKNLNARARFDFENRQAGIHKRFQIMQTVILTVITGVFIAIVATGLFGHNSANVSNGLNGVVEMRCIGGMVLHR